MNGGEVLVVDTYSASGAETESLWLTDETAAGTVQFAAFSETNTSYPNLDVEGIYNNELLFTATDAQGNYGLWTSDGTSAGTSEVTLLASTGGYGSGNWVGALNGKEVLQVSSSSASGETESLWLTDGTAAGTVQLAVFSETNTTYPNLDVEGICNNKLLFHRNRRPRQLRLVGQRRHVLRNI